VYREPTRVPRVIAAILLFLSQPLFAFAAQWVNASTPHFELYTQLNNQQAMQALQVFEQARAFFLQTGFGRSLANGSVTIIDLASEIEYNPYLIKPGAHACYQRGRHGDYVIMRDLSPSHYQVAVHEYTHFVMERAGLRLPIWLNEGLAELYATLEPRGEKCLIGRAHPGRLVVLQTQPRLRLDALLQVDRSSDYYNNPEKMQVFYAESWALTHMLAVGADYSSHFNAFVAAVSSGHSSREALELTYGKDVPSVEADLQRYLRKRNLPALLYDIKVARDFEAPAFKSLSETDLDLSFADLLASNPEAGPNVADKVAVLSRKHPDSAGFEESLGYLALRENRPDAARSHFENAVQRKSNDPVAIYNSARLEQSSGVPAAQVLPLLERALTLNPDYEPARIDLGFTAAQANRFDLAVSALSQLKSLQPSLAFEVLFTIAYCDLHLERLQDAAAYASAAQQHARSSDQQNRASALSRVIDDRQVSFERH
jgi:hypothetical protein